MRTGGAFGQKALSSPFSLPVEQGRHAWAPAAVLAGGPGHGGGRGHGGKREGGSWGRLPPRFQGRRPAGRGAMAAGGSRREQCGSSTLHVRTDLKPILTVAIWT